jgi:hypothetical protein
MNAELQNQKPPIPSRLKGGPVTTEQLLAGNLAAITEIAGVLSNYLEEIVESLETIALYCYRRGTSEGLLKEGDFDGDDAPQKQEPPAPAAPAAPAGG